MADVKQFGPEMLEEALSEPSLDRYLDRAPKVGKPIDWPEMVKTLQKKRQLNIAKKEKKENEQD